MTTMPESHLGMEPSKIFNIEYDHEALMGGDRKIVTTVYGKYIYHKLGSQWVLKERIPVVALENEFDDAT
jgi:hypothetical protein